MPLLLLGPAGGHLGGPSLTPFTGPVTIELDLASFVCRPGLWPALADKITPDWDASNISSCAVYLVGRNGETVHVSTNEPGVEKDWPKGTPAKNCGTWVNDYSADAVTDVGADFSAGDDSTAVYTDPVRCMASQGLADYTAAKLRFVVTPVDPSLPVTVYYPQLRYTKSAQRALYVESAGSQVIVHPDGPGVRVAQHEWYDPLLGWVNPPTVAPGNYKPTIVDMMETSRLLVEGVLYDQGTPNMTTECTQRYDSFEGNSVGQVDRDSVGFVLPPTGDATWRFALVNTYSEFPPVGNIPARKRDAVTWQPTGAFGQVTWIWAQGKTVNVATTDAPAVYTPADLLLTGTEPGVAGYGVSSMAPALDNTEDNGTVRQTGTKRGKEFRWWRGVFAVWAKDKQGSYIWVAQPPWASHHLSYTDGSGNVAQDQADQPVPFAGIDATTIVDTADCDELRFCYVPGTAGTFLAAYTKDAGAGARDVYVSVTRNDGAVNWSTPVGAAMDARYPIPVGLESGAVQLYYFVFDSGTSGPGTLQACEADTIDSALSAGFGTPWTLKDQAGVDIPVEFDGFGVCVVPDSMGQLLLGCRVSGETAPSAWRSKDDGRTWLRVL